MYLGFTLDPGLCYENGYINEDFLEPESLLK